MRIGPTRLTSTRLTPARLTLIAVGGAALACRQEPLLDAREPLRVEIESLHYVRIASAVAGVSFSVRNRGPSPLRLAHCGEWVTPVIERSEDGGWREVAPGGPGPVATPTGECTLAPAAGVSSSVLLARSGTYRLKILYGPRGDESARLEAYSATFEVK